jgi:hypothetical protein
MHLSSSSRAFQRGQEHDLKHPSSLDLIISTNKTKQNKTNKQPSFIDDRWVHRAINTKTPLPRGCKTQTDTRFPLSKL